MGAGAIIAVVIATHQQRVQEVTDAFRLAGATAPARARTLAALGVTHRAEVDELAASGVLVAGPAADSWYLSEAAVMTRRDGPPPSRRTVVLTVVAGLLAVLGIVALAVVLKRQG